MSFTSDEKKLYQQIKTLSDAFLLPSTTSLDYKSAIRTATKHFKMFTEADASVLMLNDNNGNLAPVFSLGIPFSQIKDTLLSLSTRLKDIVSHPALDLRYSSFMNTPLIYNRKLVGLSAVFSIVPEKLQAFEHDKYKSLLLTMLASYFAVIIENVSLADSAKSLKLPESNWQQAFDSIGDLVSIHDADFNIIHANTAVAKMFNMNREDIVGKKCYKIFHNTEKPWEPCPHSKTLKTHVSCTEEINDPHMGGVFNITTLPCFNEAGQCTSTIHIARNVTGQKNLRDQTVRDENISAFNTLMTKIAQEITNPISLITGYTQSLLNNAPEEGRFALTEIQEHASRIAGFLSQLVNFFKQDNLIKMNIDLHTIAELAISQVSHKLEKQDVHLVRQYDTLPLVIDGNSSQMELVFINLISNALDAIESRGNIERVVTIKTERTARSARLHLADTGCGIPDENKKRVFEPFFTTKEEGKGTGLGLSICQNIIRDHHGTIQVSSELGSGTMVTIELPLTENTS